MTLGEIKNESARLSEEELRELEIWIRGLLDPRPAFLTPVETEDPEHISYRLKYFRCGTSGCRCHRGHLHGPYLFVTRHSADGTTRQHYVGRVAVERPDMPRQLELELR